MFDDIKPVWWYVSKRLTKQWRWDEMIIQKFAIID